MSQMLTILGSLGIIGAACTYFFNSLREHNQNSREKVGLVRLLYHEMQGNSMALSNQVVQSSDKMLAEKLRSGKYYLHLATAGWEAARVRLAQLLPKNEFAVICDYYTSLRTLTDYIQEQLYQGDKTDLNEALKCAKYARSRATIAINKYQKTHCILKLYKVIDSATETPLTDPYVAGSEN